MDLSRILRLLYGAGQTDKDWHVPNWNTPMANEFIEVEKQIFAAVSKLQALEAVMDDEAKQRISKEFDERYEPGGAVLATARFASPEWQQAWIELVDAIRKAESLKSAHEKAASV